MSPVPHTNRGRTTTVSKPSPAADRTACSARALVDAYRALESGRKGAVSSTFTSGSPASSAASVPTWTKRRTAASRQAPRTFSVPITLPRSKSSRFPQTPRCAAAWNASSHPSAPARMVSRSSRSPETAVAPASSTAAAERSERASARTSTPSATSLRISRPPMKPEPPVTNAAPSAMAVERIPPGRILE